MKIMKQLDLMTLKELKALKRNYEDLLIREFDILTTATRGSVEHKINEIKKTIDEITSDEDSKFWADYLYHVNS